MQEVTDSLAGFYAQRLCRSRFAYQANRERKLDGSLLQAESQRPQPFKAGPFDHPGTPPSGAFADPKGGDVLILHEMVGRWY